MDLTVQDYAGSTWSYDQSFHILQDRILVGQVDSTNSWQGTSFIIDFIGIDSTSLPQPGERYSMKWHRQFWPGDTFKFSTQIDSTVVVEDIVSDMQNIRVVPNPYIGTNAMEEAVINPFLNQPRKIMFTNLPAQCEVSIFTSSGVRVKTIHVNNVHEVGMTHWDLLNDEGLEIASGMYIYHVKSITGGHEAIGKFAVIK